MARENSENRGGASGALISAAIVVTALYFGRDILLPFALAILVSFLLTPLVERLEKWRLGRIPSVLTVVGIAFLSVGGLAFILAHQVYDLAYELPNYKENILAKAEAFQGVGGGLFERVNKSLDEMRAKLSTKSAATPGETKSGEAKPSSVADAPTDAPADANPPPNLLGERAAGAAVPIPVEVVETLSAKEIAQGVLGPLLAPLSSAAMVVVFVVFMLLKREDLRNRLIHLVGGQRLNLTTQALDDAAGRVSRYLLMQALINTAYGLVICIGLSVIGLPNALLWGVLTAVLRFVPYIGPWIAALMPIAIALAVFDGWFQPLAVVALFVVNELLSNNVIEPWLYGSSTGISTMGILVSAVFWAWIWGPVGLVMATPLTVCLTVVGRYVPQLAIFHTLLSDHEVLPARSRYYQRLLALDPEEATEVAEEYLAASSLTELYDQVLVPALGLAELDQHHGALDDVKLRFVHQATREIVEDLGERDLIARTAAAAAGETPGSSVTPSAAHAAILCLPARDEADEIACLMLVQLLEQRGLTASAASTQSLSGEMIEQVDAESVPIVCISSLPPMAATHARYLAKRLRPKFPSLRLVVGLWQAEPIGSKAQERLDATGVDKLVTTLAQAAAELERMALITPAAVASPAPTNAA